MGIWIKWGYIYASQRAKELGHTPLVIAGDVHKSYFGGEYPLGKPFQVDKVWLPKSKDWQTINSFSSHSRGTEEEIARELSLEPKDPANLIKQSPDE